MIDTYIITGFLGAGKTTLLNDLLKKLGNKKIAIIENEYGEVNIDSRLIVERYEQKYELTNGCVCCSLGDDLFDVLVDIYQSPLLPDVLMIETTGIAEVGNIITLLRSDEVSKHYRLKNTFCVVDSENLLERIENHVEVAKQIAGADILVLNKILKISAENLEYLVGYLQKIQPFAHLVLSSDGTIEDKWLNVEPIKMPKYRIALNEPQFKHNHSLSSFTLRNNCRWEVEKLQLLMQMYFLQYPNQLLRIKGFLRDTSDQLYLLQSTGKYVSLKELRKWSLEKDVESQLVIIGKNLKEETILRLVRPAMLIE